MQTQHQPVLLNESIKVLDPKPGEIIIDGTLGGAGHSKKIMEKISPNGTLLGFDLDPDAINRAQKILQEKKDPLDLDVNVLLFQDNFRNIPKVLKSEDIKKVDGVILDLGFSSDQVFSGKGFSYMKNEPLVMRYDGRVDGFTAARLVNEYDKNKLSKIIKKYGEEKFADRIAYQITKQRREESFRTTKQLVSAIKEALPNNYSPDIHPAARTFMAIRIFINKELDNLKELLKELPEILKDGARVTIISFHSLEDRIVKNKFDEMVKSGNAEYIKELIKPSEEEIAKNYRSRSSKLRSIKFKK